MNSQVKTAVALFVSGLLLSGLATAAETPVEKPWSVGEPIVTYWAGPELTDAAAQQMSEGGWNVVWCGEKDLDLAHRHGLRAMLFAPGLIAPQTLDDPAKRAELDALIQRVAGHPAMYCYFITDEPNAAAFPALGKLVAYLRERDPAHMSYINLFPTYANNDQLGNKGDTITAYTEHLRQYVEVVKPALISYDHYQFAPEGDVEGYFLNLALVRDQALHSGLPFLNIVQACTWTPARRVPGPQEMRYLIYTTLAYGAQGISYYVYCHPGHTGGIANPDGSPTPVYHALKELNVAFRKIAAQLQPLRSIGVYHLGMMPAGAQPLPAESPFRLDPAPDTLAYKPPERVRGALLGLFGAGPELTQATHVLVVNPDYQQALDTTLSGSGPLEVFDVGAAKWSAAQGNRAALHIPGGEGVLVRLAR